MKIIVNQGLLWISDTSNLKNMINRITSDKIARANGFIYVENLVKAFPENRVLRLDKDMKIIGVCDGS